MAAYSVALSNNADSAYFAEICKDLAQTLETEDGRQACEAQDEVFKICDKLYALDKLNENRLLYLRHLVLIRDESVATIYDDYQIHNDQNVLARNLFNLANQPNLDDDDEDDDEDDEDVNESTTQGTRGTVASENSSDRYPRK